MRIGIDMLEIARMKKLMNSSAGAKVFSPSELAYIRTKGEALATATGLFCAKEAYFKAVGTGVRRTELAQIEIHHDDLGRPFFPHEPNSAISISHNQTTAVAVCVIL